MTAEKPSGIAILAAKRIQKEDRWWGMYDKCCEQFPRLDAETRAWFNRNRKGQVFLNLPLDQRTKINELRNRLIKDFNGRLPLPERPMAERALRIPQARTAPTCLPSNGEVAEIAQADASTQNSEIIKFWTGLFADYADFEKEERRRPATQADSTKEKRLANGYVYCNLLARKGQLPLEIEILYSKVNPIFDLVGIWKQKLERCSRIASENGSSPSFSIKSQRHLAYWNYVVSNLNTRGALPPEAAWLSENFRPISELNGYLSLVHEIGEENITPGSSISEAVKWAKWKADAQALHREGKLSPDAVSHFNAFSGVLKA